MARATANERRLMWAVVALPIACAAGVTVVLVHLWSTIDQNVAGWITTFVVLGAAFLVWEAFGLDDAFRRAGRRTQRLVIVFVLLLALGGSLAYVFWPGTASWYLAAPRGHLSGVGNTTSVRSISAMALGRPRKLASRSAARVLVSNRLLQSSTRPNEESRPMVQAFFASNSLLLSRSRPAPPRC